MFSFSRATFHFFDPAEHRVSVMTLPSKQGNLEQFPLGFFKPTNQNPQGGVPYTDTLALPFLLGRK